MTENKQLGQVLIHLECDVEGKTNEYVVSDLKFAQTFMNVYEELKYNVEIISLNGGDPEFWLKNVKVKIVPMTTKLKNFALNGNVYKFQHSDKVRQTDLYDSVVLYTANYAFNQLYKKSSNETKYVKEIGSITITPKFKPLESGPVYRHLLEWVFFKHITFSNIGKDYIFVNINGQNREVIEFIDMLIKSYRLGVQQKDDIQEVSWTSHHPKIE